LHTKPSVRESPAERDHARRDRRRLVLIALVVFVAAATIGLLLLRWSHVSRQEELRSAARSLASSRTHAIQLRINTSLSAVYSLAAMVRESGGAAPNFERVANEMLPYYPGVSALQLAPGGVIRRIVPMQGNEGALGHDLLKDPRRDTEARRAIESRSLTLAGPFDLLQGGVGLVGRLAVFVTDSQGMDEFWGFATVLIRLDALLAASGIDQLETQHFDYRLTRVLPDSGREQVIASSGPAALNDPVLQTVEVPNGRWTLAIARRAGWANPAGWWLELGMVLLIALLLAYIAFSIQVQPVHLRRQVRSRTAELEYQATHDVLTGLANRALLNDRIEQALAGARRGKRRVAVLLLDLDRFKTVNDSLGHEAGDALLSTVAGRLQGLLRQTDTLARLGGDEFVIVLPDLDSDEHVMTVCDKVLPVVAAPVQVQAHTVWTSASIGVAVHPQDGDNGVELLRNADAAMYLAKENGRGGYRFYRPEMNASALHRLDVEAGLRQAIERGEFVACYQPQVDCHSGRITGAEALIRWQRPGHGLVSPNDFIPIAEETGLVIPIGAWMLEQACQQLRQWHERGHPHLSMAINLSPPQFHHAGFADSVESIISRTGVSPASIELELTERMVMEDVENAARTLARFRQIGIRTALDDFGTGQSNLSYLKRFPIDTLKIDQSFIGDAATNPDDDAISRAVVALSRSLNLHVMAEGVETWQQWEYVRQIGCDHGQGYLFSRPVPAAPFEALLAQTFMHPPAVRLVHSAQ
jgi:diguanylate cyclase (GGDEF)-like protein